MRGSKLTISILIILVVGLHGLPVLLNLQGKKDRIWPIMGWSMYRNARDSHQPVQAVIRRLIGVTVRDNKVDIKPEHGGLGYYAFYPLYLRPMWQGNASTAQELAARVNAYRDDPIVEFRLTSETYTVTNHGLVKEDKQGYTYRVVE
jgi:hypothetical protein